MFALGQQRVKRFGSDCTPIRTQFCKHQSCATAIARPRPKVLLRIIHSEINSAALLLNAAGISAQPYVGTCRIDQYNRYEILPGLMHNGAMTVTENTADLGGITLAHAALKRYSRIAHLRTHTG